MPFDRDTRKVRVKAITYEADGVVSLDLRPLDGAPLPPFTAGAHIELRLPNGIERSYSIANPEGETHRYVVGVQKDAGSRGGSCFIHDALRPGAELVILAPRNNFPLKEDAGHTLLIAGGIGITPIWCMTQRLAALGRSFALVYAARARRRAAFLAEIVALLGEDSPNLRLHFDEEHGGAPLDLPAVIRRARPGAHLYCCGPLPMLAAFERETAALPPERVHLEYFAPKAPVAASGGFEVVLARSGRCFTIAPGATILETLQDAGIAVNCSCLEGVCGTCETAVLEGEPEHRDSVLTPQERASNRTMMICCSGAKTPKLVLDL
ncbi:MAG TPA: PDR/VanB family oxidoreductase [Stellaceae bacterium]|nr:PDR/VanB family oxidoreductase [Stellaceae bacterium]